MYCESITNDVISNDSDDTITGHSDEFISSFLIQ